MCLCVLRSGGNNSILVDLSFSHVFSSVPQVSKLVISAALLLLEFHLLGQLCEDLWQPWGDPVPELLGNRTTQSRPTNQHWYRLSSLVRAYANMLHDVPSRYSCVSPTYLVGGRGVILCRARRIPCRRLSFRLSNMNNWSFSDPACLFNVSVGARSAAIHSRSCAETLYICDH